MHVDLEEAETLRSAIEDGNVRRVKRLVADGTDVNIPNHGGRRPLFFAAKAGHVQVVTALLALGADVHAPTAEGFRPLHVAAEFGHLQVVAALVRHGADKDLHNQVQLSYWLPPFCPVSS